MTGRRLTGTKSSTVEPDRLFELRQHLHALVKGSGSPFVIRTNANLPYTRSEPRSPGVRLESKRIVTCLRGSPSPHWGEFIQALFSNLTVLLLARRTLWASWHIKLSRILSTELMSLPLMKFLQMGVREWLITSETYWVQ